MVQPACFCTLSNKIYYSAKRKSQRRKVNKCRIGEKFGSLTHSGVEKSKIPQTIWETLTITFLSHTTQLGSHSKISLMRWRIPNNNKLQDFQLVHLNSLTSHYRIDTSHRIGTRYGKKIGNDKRRQH